MAPFRYWIGVDFGQAADYTAVCVVERKRILLHPDKPAPEVPVFTEAWSSLRGEFVHEELSPEERREELERLRPAREELHVRYLSRPPLRTSYADICRGVVDRLTTLEEPLPIEGSDPTWGFEAGLVVDATGVGRAVTDMLYVELEGRPTPEATLWPVQVTAGRHLTRSGAFLGAPKRDLIAAGVIALQEGRLKIAKDIPLRDTLIQELLDYRVKINISTGHDSYEPWREGAHDDLLFATCLACWAWSQTDSS
jgi:hypothetical protein